MANKIIELSRQSRAAEVRSQSFDAATNMVDVIWTTGATVRRCSYVNGPYDEELVVTPESVRLDRLNQGAPFLNTHDDWDLSGVMGAVVPGSAKLDGGNGIARVQLSKREDVAGFVQDIRDGVIRFISVGYRYHKVEKVESDDGTPPLWRVTDWEPLELSAVPIPADPGAVMRSGAKEQLQKFPCEIVSRALPGSSLEGVRMRMRMRARELGLTS
jgi:hypothetical protein